jgi:histidinol-phosphate aminotransferase
VLKQKLAAKLGVRRDQITLGNGSNDLLVLLAEAFLAPGLEAVYSQYAFAVYPIAVQATGATGVVTPRIRRIRLCRSGTICAQWRAPSRRARASCSSRTLTTPRDVVPAAELHAFIAAAPAHVIVALDEAYFEYTEGLGLQDGIAWLREFPNLVVFRTFSKAYVSPACAWVIP